MRIPQGPVIASLPFAAATTATAVLGAKATGAGMGRFRQLHKPSFQPPDWVFGPAWTVLYGLMTASATRIFRARRSRVRTRALALWGAQLAANAAWTPLFFAKRQRKLALADLGVLVGLVGAYAATARRIDRPAAWMMAPYLAWLGYAAALNAAIVKRNG